jgi:hypothetical protein
MTNFSQKFKQIKNSYLYKGIFFYIKYWMIIIKLETAFISRKYRTQNVLLFIITALLSIIISYNDTASFVSAEIVPKIPFLENVSNKKKVFTISSVVILLAISIPVFLNAKNDANESKELHKVTNDYVMEKIQLSIDTLYSKIEKQFNKDKTLCISLFIPIRIGFFNWRLKIVKSTRIMSQEKNSALKLNEGAIGYSLMINRSFGCDVIDVSDPSNMPDWYNKLQGDNAVLIRRSIKAVSVAVCRKAGHAALLAVDTNDINTIPLLDGDDYSESILDWVATEYEAIGLIWKAKNGI